MQTDIKGVIPIAPAVYNDQGKVDYDAYGNALDVMLTGGSHGIALFGIAGEYYKLTTEEERQLIDVTVDRCGRHGRSSIVSNTRHSTEAAVEWAKYIEANGADCMMLLPPFFLKPGGEGLYLHMKAVASAVTIPVMVQYAPDQTGVAIAPATFERLTAEVPNISFFKIECKPPGHYITQMANSSTTGDRGFFVGNAGFQLIEGLDRGAVGVMPGPSMFDVYRTIYDEYMAGNRDQAIDIHRQLVYFLNHIRQVVEMIIAFEKMILKRRGIIPSDYCRKPTFIMDATFTRIFDELYEQIVPLFSARKEKHEYHQIG